MIQYSLKVRRSFRTMANRARERNFPRNPKNHSEIDFSVSKCGRFNENRPIFHIGYYQDTTDHPNESGSTRAGHYQSLESIPGHPLPCCGGQVVEPVSVPLSPPLLLVQQPTPERENVVSKIINEETILKVLATQQSIVGQSLQRLIDMKKEIMVDTLFETEICKILMEKIRPAYDSNSDEGKKCRRLLKYFKTLCEKDPHFQNNEDLPDITDVSEPEIEDALPPRSYRSLFGVQNNQSGSIILAGSDRVENDVNDLENLTELGKGSKIKLIIFAEFSANGGGVPPIWENNQFFQMLRKCSECSLT